MTGRACALFAVALLAAGAAAQAPDPARTAEELRSLRERIGRVARELAAGEQDRSDAAEALRESEQAISEANRRLFDLKAERSRVDTELADIARRTRAVEAGLERQRALVADLLRAQHRRDGAGTLALLLGGRDPNEIARQLVYDGYIARARAAAVEGLARNVRSLAELADGARARRDRLKAIETDRLAARRMLEEELGRRKAVLAKLSRELEERRTEATTLRKDEQRLARLLASLQRVVPARPAAPRGGRVPDGSLDDVPFGRLKGRLALPVRGELAGRFGSPRSDGGLAWKGLFIESPAGSTVRAVARGRVVFADWLRGFGNLLIIDHGNGYMSLYGNNESLVRRVGDPVGGGDAIATVGSSGGNASSGLYFELRYQGKPFDPLDWVSLK